jgi:acetylglutamate kinase
VSAHVYKIGGPALEDPALLAPLADEVRRAPGRVLLVHGGGRHVERMLNALQIPSRFVNGRRETSPEAMEVVEMVLSGGTNKTLAGGLNAAGVRAVGLSGRDGGLVRARLHPELGRVGTPDRVDPQVLFALWDAGAVPVVSPVSSGPAGEAVNVNADEAALALALAVRAESLVYLSDVDGVRAEAETLRSLTGAAAQRLMDAGVITGGMAMNVRVALEAAEAGIAEVTVAGRARLVGGFPGTRVLAGGAQ